MPQFLRRERGSVLVAVLGLSIVMSMAAASLILIAANSRNDEDNALQRLRCRYDAESGLMIGVGWLRNHPPAGLFIAQNQGWLNDNRLILWSSLFDNGSRVSISIVDSVLAGPPVSTKTVVSVATLGTETVRLGWDLAYDPTAGGGTGKSPDGGVALIMSRWREF